ncbi:MAG: hypothetical protein HY693_03415 [Deltaproteobacteria bacterium]|nr:hypothetical protein [Deltaproteobacteria bacterium]
MADGLTDSQSSKKGKGYVALWFVEAVLIIFWGAMIFSVLSVLSSHIGLCGLWALGVLIMVILLFLAGYEINGHWFGVLIDTRNKFSLSRLQITLWTIMVLSAYLTMALPRVIAMTGNEKMLQQALNIKFPEELLLAMGISAVSFAGANLIKSNKKSKQVKIETRNTPDAALQRRDQAKLDFGKAEDNLLLLAAKEINGGQAVDADKAELASAANKEDAQRKLDRTQMLYEAMKTDKCKATKERDAKKKALQSAEEDLTAIKESQGLVHKNAHPSEARWTDLFRGEEIGNYKLVDMSKVQMIFFTVVVIVAYGAAIASMLSNVDMLRTADSLSFPEFSESLNALLGISHGTYLSVKTIDHS